MLIVEYCGLKINYFKGYIFAIKVQKIEFHNK